MKRRSGVLFPIFSLASEFGIGCFSQEAYEFIDFLKKAGQTYWQVLPLGQTGFGDSPYQPVSAFAGNPYFIDLKELMEEGFLSEEVRSLDFGQNPERVDYGAVYTNRLKALRMAYPCFREKMAQDGEEGEELSGQYQDFLSKASFWLEDYSLYCSLKDRFDGKSWLDWDPAFKERDPETIKKAESDLQESIGFYNFIQFMFYRQWERLHDYAAAQGIQIIGDVPFYVSMDSCDAWAHPEVFRFDRNLDPEVVAGCPPDAFSQTGQLWGNPIYDWEAERKRKYSWWIRRIRANAELFDILRIDHFHGFAEYYEIPFGDETAENGEIRKGPGMDFFREMKRQIGDVPIIAEDLGTITPLNEKLLKDSGYPGMKVLQYAFDGSESSWYLPYKHPFNCVVYTGTHDNTTILDWVEHASDHDRDFARQYIHSENTDYGTFVWDFIREAYRSTADTCIIPLQDYLVMGAEARINTPGSFGRNWQWRLKPHYLSDALAQSMYRLAHIYGRLPEPEEEAGKDEEVDIVSNMRENNKEF
ncbi:MAG: 4-alpha-glucanotransferase [Eubacterium sp.]|nr:4-alpha-glucanotransferase [Eubacterium sp.]